MTKLIFASLITVSSFASLPAAVAQQAPQIRPPTPPGPPTGAPVTCSRTSSELAGVFERHYPITTDRKATPVRIVTDSSFVMLESGAWTYEKLDERGVV